MDIGFVENLDFFAQASVAIIMEASPFLLLGSLASGLFEVFVPEKRIRALMPSNPLAGVAFGAVLGMLLPCCECGVVPLVRRLLNKGVPPATAITFMLAGPVINPVVLASTFVAFQGDARMPLLRCLLVGLIAMVMGFVLRKKTPEELLLPRAKAMQAACGCQSAPAGPFGSLENAVEPSALAPPRFAAKMDHALRHALADFLEMGKVLILGAMVASAFKTMAPEGLVSIMEQDLLLSVLGMMLLAIILSLCSQADAFVASSFTGFPFAAKLAFLALGPVLDFKLVLMWGGVFRGNVVRKLILIPAVLVFAACMLLGTWQHMGTS